MSYVLDALKKADAEREQGAVPGLHAQPAPSLFDNDHGLQGMPPWVWLLSGAAIVMVIGGGAWWMIGQGSPHSAPSAARVQIPLAAQSERPLPPRAAAATPRVVLIEQPVAMMPPQPELSYKPKPVSRRFDTGNDRVTDALPSVKKAEVVQASVDTGVARSAVQGIAAVASDEGRIKALNELPEDVRRTLPPLTIGGSIYSDSPASRFIIINGQIFHENDKLGPDLTLEQIRLKLAILRYKDTRFRVMY